jgi:hypothetical protein
MFAANQYPRTAFFATVSRLETLPDLTKLSAALGG